MYRNTTTHFFVALTAIWFLFSTIDVIPVAEAKTKIKHSEVNKARVGERIPIDARIRDDAGVDLARVYFKSQTAKDYHFVPMQSTADEYMAILPAPSEQGQVEYLILVKNRANEVRRSKVFSIKVKKSRDRAVAQPGDRIDVYTELPEAPTTITGFSDNIAIDVVESGARYGVVAGLYSGAAGGSGAAGTVDATNAGLASGGVSTGAIVGVGLGVLAAGAAGGGGSGGGSASGSGSGSGSGAGAIDISGTWTGVSRLDAGSPLGPFTCTFNVVFIFNQTGTSVSGSGSDSLASGICGPGGTFTLSGTISGNVLNASIAGNPLTLTFQGDSATGNSPGFRQVSTYSLRRN